MAIDPQHYPVLDTVVHSTWPGNTIRWPAGEPEFEWQADAGAPPSDTEINAACAAFIDGGGMATHRQQTERLEALVNLQNGGNLGKLVRGLALVLLDELNAHATKINEILDAADNAVSLADFKARMAIITNYPQRTKANLVNGVTNKINEGSADTGD